MELVPNGACSCRPARVHGFRTFCHRPLHRHWAFGPFVLDVKATSRRGRLLDGPGSIERRTVIDCPALPGSRRPNHGGHGPSASADGARTRLTDASATGRRGGEGGGGFPEEGLEEEDPLADRRWDSHSERSDGPMTGTDVPRGRSLPRVLGFELLCIKRLCEADAHNNQSTDENEVAINT